MPRAVDVCYRYDGSLDGLLCCIFDSYARDEIPALIAPEDGAQVTLYPIHQVQTVRERARRVSIAIHQKISPDALLLVRLAHLTCLPNRENHVLTFVRLGFQEGRRVTGLMADPRVEVLLKATRHLKNEQHLYKGFIRFSEIDEILLAEIEPKNFVLPLIATHFAGRFSGESFMIYDKTHKAALLYSGGQKEIVKLESFTIPLASPGEQQYRKLWKRFYDTIAIESRENPRCRMSLMPKRYWGVMTEFLEADSTPLPGVALPVPRTRQLGGGKADAFTAPEIAAPHHQS